MTSHEGDRRRASPALLLIAAPLVACLTSYPGRVPGDTKLSLYLNPRRLISDSIWTWDQRTFAGWVPHQNVGYLWPTGPFYALFDAIGIPDWITHRLWISLLLAIAGVGAHRLGSRLGLSAPAAVIAGLAYQFSPYVLPYISRTSALLLPWSLLPWLIHYCLQYAESRRIRALAIFGLLVASSGGLNATALLMIAPAPLIWLIHRRRTTSMSLRQFAAVVFPLVFVSVAVSTWWLAGLYVQGRFGAAVLSYSEALESTSATSTAPEVLRGLGYWLFYDKGPIVPLTSASIPYQESVLLITASGLLVVLALWGISRNLRWRQPLSAMLLTGVVLAVGAHPFDNPSPLFSSLANNPKDALSLALRSSTRAVPMVVLALAIGLGSLWHQYERSRPRRRFGLFALLTALIVSNLPSAVTGDLVDKVLIRPEALPEAWVRAGAFLDERFDEGDTGSVLLVPGIESAAYRWGYPVDQILPAITRKPLLTREWLPLGSAAVMDLLYALDDAFQNGTASPDSIAPVARLLGADTVMFVSSHQYERFGTIRPSRARDVFEPVPSGLRVLAEFGEPTVNRSQLESGDEPLWTQEYIEFPDRTLPEITLYEVLDPSPPAGQFDDVVLVSADGTGLVDLAAAGKLDGHELLLSEASLSSQLLHDVTKSANRFIITDSNRRRAHHWRSSQDVWGATEPEAGILTVQDNFDSRLPVHPDQLLESETLIESAPVRARATAYGPALRFLPEYRPLMAVDGDPSTAWLIGPDRGAVGHVLTIDSEDPIHTLLLLQPLVEPETTWISRISVRVDGARWVSVSLDDTSLHAPGASIELPTSGLRVDIRIDALSDHSGDAQSSPVGFAEVLPADSASEEIVQIPSRITPPQGAAIEYVFSRLRSDPFDPEREDPEKSIIRRLPHRTSLENLQLEVRLDQRAPDDVLMRAIGVESGRASTRLIGSAQWWGPSAFDGDPSTAWRSPVVATAASEHLSELTMQLDRPMRWIEFDQIASATTSPITSVELSFHASGKTVDSLVLDFDASSPLERFDVPTIKADSVTISVVDVDEHLVTNPYSHRTEVAPIALAEIRSDSWMNRRLPESFDSGCREDLITIGGASVPIRIFGTVQAALSGRILSAENCSDTSIFSDSGSVLSTRPGADSGWDIDRLSFGPDPSSRPLGPAVPLDLIHTRTRYSVTSPGCSERCWIQMPFGYSSGWKATVDGNRPPTLMRAASGRSVWPVESLEAGAELTAMWFPQKYMWWGILISVVTLITLLGFSLASSARGVSSSRDETFPLMAPREPRSSRRWLSVVTGVVLGFLVIGPAWGIALGAVILAGRRISLIRLALFGAALGYAFVVLQRLRTGAPAGFLWPSVFERAHRPLLGVLIVFAIACFDTWTDSPSDFSLHREPHSSLRD